VQVNNRAFAVNPQRRIRILLQHPQFFSALYHLEHPHIRRSAHPHFTGGTQSQINIHFCPW